MGVGGALEGKYVFKSILLGSAVLLSVSAFAQDEETTEAAPATGWSVLEYETELESPPVFVAARSEEGPALIFFCSMDLGIYTVLAYVPEDDLMAQVTRREHMTHRHYGRVTIDDDTIGHNWRWKDDNGTVEVRDREIGFKLLNAVFASKPIEFSFRRIDDYTLTLPGPDEGLRSFIQQCPVTQSS